jgi:hypothetical protein
VVNLDGISPEPATNIRTSNQTALLKSSLLYTKQSRPRFYSHIDHPEKNVLKFGCKLLVSLSYRLVTPEFQSGYSIVTQPDIDGEHVLNAMRLRVFRNLEVIIRCSQKICQLLIGPSMTARSIRL